MQQPTKLPAVSTSVTPNQSTTDKTKVASSSSKLPSRGQQSLIIKKTSFFLPRPTLKFDVDNQDSNKLNEYISKQFIEKLKSKSKATLVVGGVKFQILWTSLTTLPNTRLGQLESCGNRKNLQILCNGYNLKKSKFYFDRDSTCFATILNLYRTGSLHMNVQCCAKTFCEELAYWGIQDDMVDVCCQKVFIKERDMAMERIRLSAEEYALEKHNNEFPQWKYAHIQKQMHLFFEDIHSSVWAKVAFYLSLFAVFFSNILVIIESMFEHSARVKLIILSLETVLLIFFLFEFFLRYFAAPRKRVFMIGKLNIIDLLAIFSMSLTILSIEQMLSMQLTEMLHIFRVIRTLRILKISRFSRGLQSLGNTFLFSYKELGMVLLLVGIGVVFYGYLVFSLEEINEPKGRNILTVMDGLWWAINTLTTVGYGDYVPKSPVGKIFGGTACICGVLIIALPIPIIIVKFEDCYQTQSYADCARRRLNAVNKLYNYKSDDDSSKDK